MGFQNKSRFSLAQVMVPTYSRHPSGLEWDQEAVEKSGGKRESWDLALKGISYEGEFGVVTRESKIIQLLFGSDAWILLLLPGCSICILSISELPKFWHRDYLSMKIYSMSKAN